MSFHRISRNWNSFGDRLNINADQLKDNRLLLAYKGHGTRIKLGNSPRPLVISENLTGLLINLLDTGIVDSSAQSQLSYEENILLKKILFKAGLRALYKPPHCESPADRFEFLKAAYIAGNDSKEVVAEMKLLLDTLYTKQLIDEADYRDLVSML